MEAVCKNPTQTVPLRFYADAEHLMILFEGLHGYTSETPHNFNEI